MSWYCGVGQCPCRSVYKFMGFVGISTNSHAYMISMIFKKRGTIFSLSVTLDQTVHFIGCNCFCGMLDSLSLITYLALISNTLISILRSIPPYKKKNSSYKEFFGKKLRITRVEWSRDDVPRFCSTLFHSFRLL